MSESKYELKKAVPQHLKNLQSKLIKGIPSSSSKCSDMNVLSGKSMSYMIRQNPQSDVNVETIKTIYEPVHIEASDCESSDFQQTDRSIQFMLSLAQAKKESSELIEIADKIDEKIDIIYQNIQILADNGDILKECAIELVAELKSRKRK